MVRRHWRDFCIVLIVSSATETLRKQSCLVQANGFGVSSLSGGPTPPTSKNAVDSSLLQRKSTTATLSDPLSEIMDLDNEEEKTLWTYADPDAFADLNHPGYSTEADPETFVGGWKAHLFATQPMDGVETPKDWIVNEITEMITKFDYTKMPIGRSPRILVLYGSLREQSYSRKLAYEFARLLELLECDVRVYNPRGLPVRDPALEDNIKGMFFERTITTICFYPY